MSSIDNTPAARKVVYDQPQVRDYGSLVTLTADFDVHFVGSVAKIVTLATVSSPLAVGGGATGPGGGGGSAGSLAPSNLTPDTGGVLSDIAQADGVPEGGTETPATIDNGTGVLADGPAGGGEAAGSGSIGGGAGAGGGGEGGRLPFTGYAAATVAALGAAFTGAGVAVRALLRRRS